MHTIGQFSALTQIPIKTLRYYDEIGLLRPARVERGSGYRYYTAEQVEQLNRILVLKDLGCSLREIRELMAENVTASAIRALLMSKRAALECHVERERARLVRAAARLDLLAHDVAVRDTGAWLTASIRDTVTSHDECERLFDELHWHIDDARKRCRGVVWHACAPGHIDCEVFAILPSRVEARGRVRIAETPAQRIASLVYRESTDYPAVYRTMRAWIAATGVAVIGPKREIFLDAAVTDLQFPIQ